MNRLSFGILFLFLACAPRFAQSEYKGLTPGTNTRADTERVFGKEVKQVSQTLFEYKEPGLEGIDQIFVQYRDTSSAAVVERIELVCDRGRTEDRPNGCAALSRRLTAVAEASHNSREYADITERQSSGAFIRQVYYGPPLFLVSSWSINKEPPRSRLGLYSPELFEAAVPRNCTGTFLGAWETNRGRLVLSDIPGTHRDNGDVNDTNGEYSINRGTVTGHSRNSSTLTGEWKDATGSGTFVININNGHPYEPNLSDRTMFTGTWERRTGKGPKKGTWEGRCTESKS